MEISEITSHDINKLRGVQPEGWPDITPSFRFYLQSDFCKPLKFCIDGVIAGTGVIILHISSAWLGHILVRPEFRKQGIGMFITRHLIDKIDPKTYPTISLIATEMGEPVYRKAGFQKSTDYVFYKSENLNSMPVRSTIIKDTKPADFEDILKLDQVISGEDRSQLLHGHLVNLKIIRDGKSLIGVYMPALGDGMIAAIDKEAGIELLNLHLQTKNICVLPEDNLNAIDFLESKGFKPVRKGARMWLGDRLDYKPEMIFSRIAGNLG